MKTLINKMNLALVLPVLGLLILTGYQQLLISTGTEVVLPINGYDPRDLLSGHYITYTIDFESVQPCQKNRGGDEQHYIYLEPRFESPVYPRDCRVFIKGKCKSRRFEAGIERFYISESDAQRVEKSVKNKKASILISVSRDGTAKVKELLLNGKPWKEVELSP